MANNLSIYNYSTRNLFVWNNRFNSISATYTDSGSGSTLLAGMLIGRIAATGKVAQSISTATDGSQIPIGILLDNYTVAASADQAVVFCIQGDVDYGLIIYGGSPTDTIATKITQDSGAVQMGTIGDILNGKGILPITTTEMTYQDTQN